MRTFGHSVHNGIGLSSVKHIIDITDITCVMEMCMCSDSSIFVTDKEKRCDAVKHRGGTCTVCGSLLRPLVSATEATVTTTLRDCPVHTIPS